MKNNCKINTDKKLGVNNLLQMLYERCINTNAPNRVRCKKGPSTTCRLWGTFSHALISVRCEIIKATTTTTDMGRKILRYPHLLNRKQDAGIIALQTTIISKVIRSTPSVFQEQFFMNNHFLLCFEPLLMNKYNILCFLTKSRHIYESCRR